MGGKSDTRQDNILRVALPLSTGANEIADAHKIRSPGDKTEKEKKSKVYSALMGVVRWCRVRGTGNARCRVWRELFQVIFAGVKRLGELLCLPCTYCRSIVGNAPRPITMGCEKRLVPSSLTVSLQLRTASAVQRSENGSGTGPGCAGARLR